MARIGYGTDKATRHMLRNGFKKVTVHNEKELETLLMNNGVFCAELAANLSSRKKA